MSQKLQRLLSERVFRHTTLELRVAKPGDAEPLPDGVCGRITGVALVYNVPDDYGTIFVPGCLAKTRAERVNTGKVKLFADHGPFTDTHVGVVRALEDVGDSAVMTADLFDTESGRAMKEYIQAVLASGADTGISIGFRPRAKKWDESPEGFEGGDMCLYFTEIELRECSITPVPAVPGADVVSVRREAGETDEGLMRRALEHILRALPEREARAVFDEVYAPSAAQPDTAAATTQPPAGAGTDNTGPAAESATADSAVKLASPDERMRAVRQSYARAGT